MIIIKKIYQQYNFTFGRKFKKMFITFDDQIIGGLCVAILLIVSVIAYKLFKRREGFCHQKFPREHAPGMRGFCPSGCSYNPSTKTCDGICEVN